MFDLLTLRAADPEASERFYALVLATLGTERDGERRWGNFCVIGGGGRVTRGLHIGFAAPSREHVDAFWKAGVDAGYTDDGEPGRRPEYGGDYYGGFLLDPDGNSAEAVHHDDLPDLSVIDHVWIRVPDVAAAKRDTEALAPLAGIRLGTDLPERAQFRGPDKGSFSLVAGEPSHNVHLVVGGVQLAYGSSQRTLT